jgi:hypothetical protein
MLLDYSILFLFLKRKVVGGRKDYKIGNLIMEMKGNDWSVLRSLGHIKNLWDLTLLDYSILDFPLLKMEKMLVPEERNFYERL